MQAPRGVDPALGPESSAPPLSSILLWGPAGAERDETAVRLARWWDPMFRWVEIQDPADPAPSRDLWLREVAGKDRVWTIRQASDVIQNAMLSSTAAMWSLLRPDEAAELKDAVTDFLAAPDVLQRVISEATSKTPIRCVVIANIDRLDPRIRETDGVLESMVRALNREQITPIFTCTGRPVLRQEPGLYELYVPLRSTVEVSCPAVCLWGGEKGCMILRALPDNLVRCRREVPAVGIIPGKTCQADESTHSVGALRPPTNH